ncbi:hypothetical protein K492DRAFT_181151 [Lichtheimia hyalospora FSU 10163]|nr:hypothetical protein K492DRAFT_181151 [Lichtheimia hyalospora FSU 10163]
MAPLDNSCSAIEIVEWPRPKICIGIDRTLLDNVQRALDAPIEIMDDDNDATTQISNKRPSRTQMNRVQPAKKPRVTFAETSSSTRTTNATNNSNRTSPVTSHQQRRNNFLQWHVIEVGKVQHAHQNGPPRMPGGVDEYAGRKTVRQWLDAEQKYKKDVKKIRVPVYKDADRLIARPGAVEAKINLTRIPNQRGAPICKLHDQLLIEIFKHCSHIQTLSTVVTVCHQWRRLGLDPIVASNYSTSIHMVH